ncbi:MAG: immune inhibitor A [Candidatus Marinimicrobia bacterium]|nr:immune inhibitor A [Candidatus Neomarinimicrobiota bacterium]
MLRQLTTLTITLLMLGQTTIGQERFDQLRIWSDDTDLTLIELLRLGIDPEGMNIRPGVYVDVIVNQSERKSVEAQGMLAEEIIEDLSTYYESQLTQSANRELGYGSMGGYLTFDEIVESMDSLHAQYPGIVSARDSIGQSYEGRTIWAFKISDNPEQDENEPEVFYNSLIHAREPAAMMTLMYFAWQLVENYDVDLMMTYLVNEREMWFVPVVNPDGYVYNQFTNPNGGGMHRKNRHLGCTSSAGIDLNRNWSYEWGYDDEGSSPDSCGSTYRGSGPFSEPETQTIRDFVLNHDFQTVFNYHSYGNLLIRPFGYELIVELPNLDRDIFMELGRDLVADNSYLFGTGAETVGYLTNGDAVDYMYGDQGIINFTPEVGAWAQGGFWPPTDLIFEMAEANLSMNTHLAAVAGSWIEIENFALRLDNVLQFETIVNSELSVRNKGLNTGNYVTTLHISSPDSSLIPSVNSYDLTGLSPQTSINLGETGLTFQVRAHSGESAQLVLSIEVEDQYTLVDTFSWPVGLPDTVFIDDFESGMENWVSGSWGVSSEAFTGLLGMADSPSGNYSGATVTTVVLDRPIDLRGYTNPVLSFDVKWDIEANYDFSQVLASADAGSTWQPLAGLYTDPGNGATVQPLGEPGYHGSHDWVRDEFSLNLFAGVPELLLSFNLMSDAFYEADGISLDNIRVLGWGVGFHPGDLNRDGQVNIADAIILLDDILSSNLLFGDDLELSDLNHDLHTDISDLVLLIEVILQN